METFRELWAGIIYMFRRWRGKETDKQARRMAAHQGVFGHSRSRIPSDGSARSKSLIHNSQEKKREKPTSPSGQVEFGRLDEVLVDVEREVYLGSERQWLGVGDGRDYVLESLTRETSEGFEDAVAKELYKRGYTLRGIILPLFRSWTQHSLSKTEASRHNKGRTVSRNVDIEQGHVRDGSRNRSWWRSIYQRVSQSGGEDEQEKHLSPRPKRKSASRPKDPPQALPLIKEMPMPGTDYAYEDPPPPSTLNAYRSSRLADNGRRIPCEASPRASPPIPIFSRRSPEPARLMLNPPAQLNRSDSLLNRVFAYLGSDAHTTNTELDHGTESQPSRSTSLWRAGSANVVPKHVPESPSVMQANVSYGADPQPVTPVRGDFSGASQDEEPPTLPPKRSHIRDMADHFATPSSSPLPQQSPPGIDRIPVRCGSQVDPPLLPRPPRIPGSGTGHDLPSPLPPLLADLESRRQIPDQGGYVDPGTIYQPPTPDPRLRPPSQESLVVGPSSPSILERPRRASRNESLLRPFPEPVHHSLPNMGPTRFTPPRSKLTIPAPLAQPLPRGSGSLKRNRTNTLPAPEQPAPPNEEPYREPHLRRHSQPVPVSRHTTDHNSVPYLPNSPSRNPHRRTSQPLPVLQEASYPHMSRPTSPPQRSSRRMSSPPMSTLPLNNRPTRSNAVHRKSPGSPTRATSPHKSLLTELRSVPPIDSNNFSRYPVPGPGQETGSPSRVNRIGPLSSPFVNIHMLPSPTSSPRSDVE